ncbi:hypothetical protein BXZ70DRAFT_895665 [Cristinia sonorae]|uniref:Uncharacterized protein n=1 Tax=Cristinia sonorae TaxID=1940300 RepID=A0A8K0UMV2_9AGAR|nr:hypothetical protein BXZ70DRAFT_895665 [Cristinia sonorae]
MFRLPTHLETFVPPPTEQVPQTRPWRGTLVLSNPSSPPASSHTVIYCAAAETEGDNQVQTWPPQFVIQILNHRPMLPQFQAWVKANAVPMCMFMPDRLADRDAHKRNIASFELLAKTLHDNQFVAVAPWNSSDRTSGGGLILYPTVTSTALLVGAIFLQNGFPDFLGVNPRSHVLPVPRAQSYSPSGSSATPNIATSQRHGRGGGGYAG